MSKRHRKIRDMMSSDDDFGLYSLDMYEAPRGRKPKGKERRQSFKKAYYDD